MGKDRVTGTIRQVTVRAWESPGKRAGDLSRAKECRIEKTERRLRNAFGIAKDALHNP